MKTEASEQFRKEVCEKLAEIAKEKGITQSQLAEKTGMEQSSINRILNYKFSPTIDLLFIIATALDCEIQIIKH